MISKSTPLSETESLACSCSNLDSKGKAAINGEDVPTTVPESYLSPLIRRFSGKSDPSRGPLPPRVGQTSEYGLYALLIGSALMGIAFLTNPVPDPSFPWATLPESLRLSYTQPRIEHWPVTYTVGLWLIVFSLPLVILRAYQRYGSDAQLSASRWLAALPVTTMLALTTYCRFFWPKLDPATWNAPSYTLVCWGYCSSYVPFWSNLAYAVVLLGVGAAYLTYRDSPRAKYGLAAWGALAFPLGIPALYEACRRYADSKQTNPA
jgi:hypothetical protein